MNREKLLNTTRRFRKTPKGVLTNLYSKMKDRNIEKGFGCLLFSLQELQNNYLTDKKYLKIFSAWELGNYDIKLKPSFDRINPTLGYSLQNIEIKTWGENRKKADWEKSFIYTTAVEMLDMNGKLIRDFNSTKEAVYSTGIRQSTITSCCQGVYKSAGGYIFRYRGDKFRCRRIHDNPSLLEVGR